MATKTLTGMSFSNYSGAYAIDITTAGTYTLDACTFDLSGTDAIETSHSSGLVTIVLTNGTTPLVIGDIDNTGGGTVAIENNVTLKVTVKDAVTKAVITNARVFLETDPGGTELFNEVTGGDGFVTDTYNYSTDQAVTGVVRQGTTSPYYKSGAITATITSAGLDLTILMALDE